MSSYQKILYHVDGGVARITLNRPEKRNALIAETDRRAEGRRRPHRIAFVILLSGRGRGFLFRRGFERFDKACRSRRAGSYGERRAAWRSLFLAMRRHPHPIIAAVRGRALAGGCGLGHGGRSYPGRGIGAVRLSGSEHRVRPRNGDGYSAHAPCPKNARSS